MRSSSKQEGVEPSSRPTLSSLFFPKPWRVCPSYWSQCRRCQLFLSYMCITELSPHYLFFLCLKILFLFQCVLSSSGSVNQNKLSAEKKKKHFSVKEYTGVGLNPSKAKNTKPTIENGTEWNPAEVSLQEEKQWFTTTDPNSDGVTFCQLKLGPTIRLVLVLKGAWKEILTYIVVHVSAASFKGNTAPPSIDD